MLDLLYPTWLTGEVAVGIVAIVIAFIGVLIAYREWKPGLKVQVTRCTHKVRYMGSTQDRNAITGTELLADFNIRNTGGRTQIYEVEIRCKPSALDYRTTERVQSIRYVTIEKGDTQNYTHQFYMSRRGVFDNPLSCTFFLHHTHGKKKVKAKSNLRE